MDLPMLICFLLTVRPSQNATQSVRVQKLTQKKRRHPNTGVVPHLSPTIVSCTRTIGLSLRDDRDSTCMPRDPNNHKRMEMRAIGLSDIVFCIAPVSRNTATQRTPHRKAKIIDFQSPVDQLSPLHRKAKSRHRPLLEENNPPLGFVPFQ